MTVWIITLLVAAAVAAIIFTEVKCGRRSKDFFETIGPEIEALNKSVARKYRAKYGRDPTGQFKPIKRPPGPRRGWFRK